MFITLAEMKLPAFCVPYGEIEADVGGAEGAVGRVDLAVRLRIAQAGARGGDDDQRGLAAVLGRRRAGNDFERLHRVHGDLVGEGLRLLVGDGLAVDGEGVGGVVAHAVEHAVGVGRDAGRGERNQRTDRGGCRSSGILAKRSRSTSVWPTGSVSIRSPLVAVTSTVVLVAATCSVMFSVQARRTAPGRSALREPAWGR